MPEYKIHGEQCSCDAKLLKKKKFQEIGIKGVDSKSVADLSRR